MLPTILLLVIQSAVPDVLADRGGSRTAGVWMNPLKGYITVNRGSELSIPPYIKSTTVTCCSAFLLFIVSLYLFFFLLYFGNGLIVSLVFQYVRNIAIQQSTDCIDNIQ